MKTLIAIFLLATISQIIAEDTKPNILLICIDDLRPELGCYGKSYMHTPHIDTLGNQGRIFRRHYVQAPTCGASRHSLLTGRYPRTPEDLRNQAISIRVKKKTLPPTIPQVFKQSGYTTLSVGKVSHHPGGLMGKEWNDPNKEEMPGVWDQKIMPCAEWKTPFRLMHGIADGIPRTRGVTPAIEVKEGPDTIYPDGHISDSAVKSIQNLSKTDQPWFLAVGLMKPHLPFTAPKKYWDLYEGKKLPVVNHPDKPSRNISWSKSREFFGSYNHDKKDPRTDAVYAATVRRHYYASVSYVDAQVGKLLTAIEQSGQKENTIILLWGDHGWNLGERAIWGKHNLYEEALLAPLIIYTPGMKDAGTPANAITETTDIFPTLCELSGVEKPDTLDGTSLKAQIDNPRAPTDGTAISFWQDSQSIRTDKYRLTRQIKKNQASYDLFLFPEKEEPSKELVDQVKKHLSNRFFTPKD